MSDERRSEGGGAIVVIVVVLIVIGLLGVVGVGGGAWVMHRTTLARMQAEVMERQALAEMMEAEMRAKAAAVEALDARDRATAVLAESVTVSGEANAPEILLQIDASGNYTLAGKTVLLEDLVSSLTHAKAELPPETRLKIQATTKTPFEAVEKAMKAGVDAGLKAQSVDNTREP